MTGEILGNLSLRRRHCNLDSPSPQSRPDEFEVFRVFRDLLGCDNPDAPQLLLTNKQCDRSAWVSSGSRHSRGLTSRVVVVEDSITEQRLLSTRSFNFDPQRQ